MEGGENPLEGGNPALGELERGGKREEMVEGPNTPKAMGMCQAG